MPLGVPRTEEERMARHRSFYGEGSVPPAVRRRQGPSMETAQEVLWAWLPDFPPGLPLPRWLNVRIFGAGRRL